MVKEFKDLIAKLKVVIPSRDILQGVVKLFTDGGFLYAQGGTSEIIIQTKIRADFCLAPVVVPFEPLSRLKPKKTIEFSKTSEGLSVCADGVLLKLPVIGDRNFDFDEPFVTNFDTDELNQLIWFTEGLTGDLPKYRAVYFDNGTALVGNVTGMGKINTSLNCDCVDYGHLLTINKLIGKTKQFQFGTEGNFAYFSFDDTKVKITKMVLESPTFPDIVGRHFTIQIDRQMFVDVLVQIESIQPQAINLILDSDELTILARENLMETQVVLRNEVSGNGFIKLSLSQLKKLLKVSDCVFTVGVYDQVVKLETPEYTLLQLGLTR